MTRSHLVIGILGVTFAFLAAATLLGRTASVVLSPRASRAPAQAWDAGSAADDNAPIPDDEVSKAADILFGYGLDVSNADPLHLLPDEAMVLSGRSGEVHVTLGPIVLRTADCADGPYVTIGVTVTAEKGSTTVDPSWYRLRTIQGEDADALPGCGTSLAGPAVVKAGDRLSGELAFASVSPGWLRFGPDPDSPEAIWRLG